MKSLLISERSWSRGGSKGSETKTPLEMNPTGTKTGPLKHYTAGLETARVSTMGAGNMTEQQIETLEMLLSKAEEAASLLFSSSLPVRQLGVHWVTNAAREVGASEQEVYSWIRAKRVS